MRNHLFGLFLILFFFPTIAVAKEPAQKSGDGQKTVKATYLITGLHCSSCTNTIETSLRKAKGIHSITVDWNTKKARIEVDEAVVPAQKVAQLVADTPHFMGPDMHYGAWLMLKVPAVKDETTAKKAKAAVSKAAGVQHVIAYPADHTIGVQFPVKGEMTSRQLVESLRKIGIEATTY
jgi:copper chaperone CopZ